MTHNVTGSTARRGSADSMSELTQQRNESCDGPWLQTTLRQTEPRSTLGCHVRSNVECSVLHFTPINVARYVLPRPASRVIHQRQWFSVLLQLCGCNSLFGLIRSQIGRLVSRCNCGLLAEKIFKPSARRHPTDHWQWTRHRGQCESRQCRRQCCCRLGFARSDCG